MRAIAAVTSGGAHRFDDNSMPALITIFINSFLIFSNPFAILLANSVGHEGKRTIVLATETACDGTVSSNNIICTIFILTIHTHSDVPA